jgi:hypothetical protein
MFYENVGDEVPEEGSGALSQKEILHNLIAVLEQL